MYPSPNSAVPAGAARDLDPGQIEFLRPYVVNLNLGQFSQDGAMSTDQADVDAIFDEHLPAFLDRATRPVPLVIWAHGGLVGEQSGLAIAANQVPWWLRNGAYPLHFVWETGFLDALKQILAGRETRDLADHTIDPLTEFLARPVGSRLWTAMKTSADLASAPDGGARYVARRLAQFCQANPGRITLHAVGHSAGAIFHSHFIPAATRDEGVPSFDSLQLLAPALRVDGFLARLLPLAGGDVRALTMYTMNKQTERDDNCFHIYRKSLLYLVSRAFEADSEAPIVGLEQSVRADAALVDLFGLRSGVQGKATVIWSPTSGQAPPNSASRSTSHGGFDNDLATMNSVARRILGRDAIDEFPVGSRSSSRDLDTTLGRSELPNGNAGPMQFRVESQVFTEPGRADVQVVATGARKALCIGIDAYPAPHALGGCVADMQSWAALFGGLGFGVQTMSDEAATRDAVLAGLRELISTSSPGDVLAFQYSGHGTKVPDLDGDEEPGFNTDSDEAICPVDFADGKLIIDDELRAVLSTLPAGVSLTTFFDCCHSGSNTRALDTVGPRVVGAGKRARFVVATPALVERVREFRQTLAAPARRSAVTTEQMRNVSVAACQDHEVAYESGGHGHFTTRAMRILSGGVAGLTNRSFTDQVTALFGTLPEQTPMLDCRKEAEGQPLLAAVAGPVRFGGTAPSPGSVVTAAVPGAPVLADLLRALAKVLDSGPSAP